MFDFTKEFIRCHPLPRKKGQEVSSIYGIYKHANGKKYSVIGDCKMKNPQTREWEDGVIYQADSMSNLGDSNIYVRTKADFEERFAEVRDQADGKRTPIHPNENQGEVGADPSRGK